MFGMFTSDIQKGQGIIIAQCQYSLLLDSLGQCLVIIALTKQIILECFGFNLMQKYIFSPTKTFGSKDIETTFLSVFALGKYEDMFSPTNFTNQWLENCI